MPKNKFYFFIHIKGKQVVTEAGEKNGRTETDQINMKRIKDAHYNQNF